MQISRAKSTSLKIHLFKYLQIVKVFQNSIAHWLFDCPFFCKRLKKKNDEN